MGDGVYTQSRQSANLFNVAHFRANTKSTQIMIRELVFADDSALVAHPAEEMQKIVDAFSNASKKLGLKIIIKKTEVLYQPNSTRTREQDIMVDGNKLNSVLEFTYHESPISSNGCNDDEIQRRMAKASHLLADDARDSGTTTMRDKGKICRAIALSTLLYGAEAWTVYRRQVKKLHVFIMRHLRSLMRITWMDKVTDKDILERKGLPSMEDLLIRNNLRWTGHLMMMSPDSDVFPLSTRHLVVVNEMRLRVKYLQAALFTRCRSMFVLWENERATVNVWKYCFVFEFICKIICCIFTY